MNLVIKILATGLGTGYSPFASGTVASAAALGIYFCLFPSDPLAALAVVAAVTAVSIPVCSKAEKIFGMKDDSRITLDEFVGMWISLLFLPHAPKIFAFAFLFFRVYDVYKPFGIKRVQKLGGGTGVVGDDILAGIAANLSMQALLWINFLRLK
ncbi:MAG: phosphatidylglycerophosphatase A [Endomicrobiales bacterium]|nr:phosphatidylglycerophosphatase A [Endomicrobiales bacterium]